MDLVAPPRSGLEHDTSVPGRRPGWLLAATVPVSILYIVTAVLTMKVDRAADLTPAQLADMRVGWIALNVLWALPVILVAVAVGLLAAPLRRTAAGLTVATRSLSLLAALGILVYIGLSLSVLSFDADRLGDLGRHDAATLTSLGSYWAAMVTTMLLGVALFTSRLLRRTGIVVAVIVGLLLVADVIAYLPGLTGSVSLDDVSSFPPLLISFVWLALGIGLLRRRIASAA